MWSLFWSSVFVFYHMWYGGVRRLLWYWCQNICCTYYIVDLHPWWVLGLWHIPPSVKDRRLRKPTCLRGLLACQLWQQEAVLLSKSHVSQPCHYLRNCYGFWETVWVHNHSPVKGDQETQHCQRKIHKHAQKCTDVHEQTYVCYTQVCT